jgi:hypothetical protein
MWLRPSACPISWMKVWKPYSPTAVLTSESSVALKYTLPLVGK